MLPIHLIIVRNVTISFFTGTDKTYFLIYFKLFFMKNILEKHMKCASIVTLFLSFMLSGCDKSEPAIPLDISNDSGCFFNGSVSTLGQTTKYSGNSLLDQINTEEYYFLVQKFGVVPEIFYLVDGDNPNAYATSRVSNPQFPDGTVFVGLSLIQSECFNSPSKTCSAVPIIMAHEFAHIIDFKYQTPLKGKHKELFADYLAGSYMYFRSVEFKATFVEEAALSFFRKGDFQFNSAMHHGTPEQRYECLRAGYNLAHQFSMQGKFLDLQTVIQNGIIMVTKY